MVEVLTGKKTRTIWLPYQLRWMNDISPLKLAEKSRRIGWTYHESYDATSRRFRVSDPRNMDYWFSSADESAAREFIEYCEHWAKMFDHIVNYTTEQVEDEQTKRKATAFVLRCPNGKRITAMTSNPRRFRSKGGDVCCDEFAFHDDAREMYKAAKPVTMRGGWMRIFSTHNGEESQFNKFCVQAQQVLAHLGHDPDQPPAEISYQEIRKAAKALKVIPWRLHRVTLIDAVDEGLVENINRFAGTNLSRADFIDDCRSGCIDDDMWSEEYMCVPSVGTSALLPYSLIETCERDDLAGAIGELDVPALTGGPLFLGWDIGRHRDLSVIWIFERTASALVTRAVITLDRVPFREQYDLLCKLMRDSRIMRVCIDNTGLGMPLAEAAVEDFGSYRVEPVTFSAASKAELAVPIRPAFEDGSILIPQHADIREDLHKIRRVASSGGQLRYDAARDALGHADRFWAMALAKRAAGGEAGPAEYIGSDAKLTFARDGIW